MFIVSICQFIFQNFANLDETETACDHCCGFGL